MVGECSYLRAMTDELAPNSAWHGRRYGECESLDRERHDYEQHDCTRRDLHRYVSERTLDMTTFDTTFLPAHARVIANPDVWMEGDGVAQLANGGGSHFVETVRVVDEARGVASLVPVVTVKR